MARVTIEDCLEVIGNRFELSVLAGFRAKQIARGSLSHMNKDNDKSAVIALREVADHVHERDALQGAYIASLRKNVASQDVLEEETSFVETAAEVETDAVEGEGEESSEDDSTEDAISVENYDFDDDE